MAPVPKTQAPEVTYELHSLGWRAFEDLCVTIVSELFGQSVETFLPSHDGGRDGAFHGQWGHLAEGGVHGSYTLQCKFTGDPSNKLSLAGLSDELNKARRLARRGLADNYILITNLRMSGTAAEEIRRAFIALPGIKWFVAYGSDWVSLRIRENPRLRMLVPRVYGLGDLSQILDARAYDQAEAILVAIGDDLAKFVITDAYRRSASALITHGFVMLLGEPASGKSTIAATLAMGALDTWNCSTVKPLDAQGFLDHWNPHEPRQFFWIDDAFGATQYQNDTSLAWNKAFPHLHAAIKKGARVLLTSRDYVFEAAIRDLKVSAFPLIGDSQVIINVEQLTLEERESILYNHIKLGDQPASFKTQLKPFLSEVTHAARFLPETARRLGSRVFTKRLSITRDAVMEFVERPLDFLLDVIQSLDTDARASLALIFMRGGTLESPIELSDDERGAVERLGSTLAGVGQALDALKGSLVRFMPGTQNCWQFQHPTIADAIGELIGRDAELVDVYLSGTPASKVIREITCGNVELRGANIVVPGSRYLVVIAKLNSIHASRQRFTFLAHRCDSSFLETYLTQDHDLLDQISSTGSYLCARPEVALLIRLQQAKLLPERYRQRFVANAKQLAIATPDADFLSVASIRGVFTEDEIEDILNTVKRDLLSDVSGEIDNWRCNYDSSDEPEGYFEPLIDTLQTYSDEFDESDAVQAVIESGLAEIAEVIDELRMEQEDEETDYEKLSSTSSSPNLGETRRSIFDDVDA